MKKKLLWLTCIPIALVLCSVGNDPVSDYPIAPPDEIVEAENLSFDEEVALYGRYVPYNSATMTVEEVDGELYLWYSGDENVVDCLVQREQGVNRRNGEPVESVNVTFILGNDPSADQTESFYLGSVKDTFCVQYITYTAPEKIGENALIGGTGHYELLWITEAYRAAYTE